MRIGEVTVITPPGTSKEIFIKSVCENLEEVNENICFGRLHINSQLMLHLYGISVEKDDSSISWDLLSPKMLGFIFVFDWDDYGSFDNIRTVLDIFSTKFSAPMIVLANVRDRNNIPLPDKFIEPDGFSIDRNVRFTFCQISDPACSKKAVASIIDILLEKMP